MYKLESCVWEITRACCFQCKYCGSKAGKAEKNELTLQECLNVVDQLSDLGCKRVSLIGGEVFLHSGWKTITEALTERKIRVSVITNGFLITEEIIEALKSVNVDSVAVSLDGPERIHDEYRMHGSFQKAINAIELLVKNGVPVSVITTLHHNNIDYLDEMFKLLQNKHIFAWQLQACSPMGNAEHDMDVSFDFRRAVSFVEHHRYDDCFVTGIADNIGYYSESEGYLRGNRSGYAFFRGCSAGIRSIGIDSSGNVRGCESMYADCFIEGNLRNQSLKEIWENPDGFSYNRRFSLSLLTGKCKECQYAILCKGGCRSYNYFSSQNLYESPNCISAREKN